MSTYFTEPTDKQHYSGKTIGVISNGDNQTSVLEKLASEIESLKASLSSIGISSPQSSTDSIENKSSFGGSDRFVSTSYKADITTKANTNSIDITFDLSSALGDDEKLYSNVSIEGNRAGINAILVSTDKIKSGFSLSPENFPAYITLDLRKRTATGDEFLSAKLPLNPSGESVSTPLFTRKFGASELKNQTEVNNFLFDRIRSVENSVIQDVNVNNKTYSIQEAITTLLLEIENLKKTDLSSTNITYQNGNGNVSKSISEAISDIIGAIPNTNQTNSTGSSIPSRDTSSTGDVKDTSSSNSTGSIL